MLQVLWSDFTPYGSVNISDKVKATGAANRDGGYNTTLLLADPHSLAGSPLFFKECKKYGVDGLVGVTLSVGLKSSQGKLVFVAKGPEGLDNLVSIVEDYHSADYVEFQELQGRLGGVKCIIDHRAPFVESGEHGYKALHNIMSRLVGAENINFAFHINKENFPLLQKHNNVIKRSVAGRAGALPVSMASHKDLSIAIAKHQVSDKKKNTPMRVAKEQVDESQIDSFSGGLVSSPQLIGNFKGFVADIVECGVLRSEFMPDVGIPIDIKARSRSELSKFLTAHPNLNPEVYWERLEVELGIMKGTGFEDYFKVAVGFSDYCKEKGESINMRGSASSSLVLYLAGLSAEEADPVDLDMDFRRFLIKEGRKDAPDIDIEIPSGSRHLFNDYIKQYVGEENVALLSNQGKQTKLDGLLRIARNALIVQSGNGDLHLHGVKIPRDGISKCWQAAKLKNVLRVEFGDDALKEMDFKELLLRSKAVKDLAKDLPYIKALLDESHKAYGLRGDPTDHQTAIIVRLKGGKDKNAPFVMKGGLRRAELTGDTAKSLGFLKFDIIASQKLRGLGIAEHLLGAGGVNKDELYKDIFISGKESVYPFLCSNPAGINQIAKSYGQRILSEASRGNEDKIDLHMLAAIYALTRPAISDEERKLFAQGFQKGDKNRHVLDISNPFTDPDVSNILSKSNGALIFDEQILQIAIDVGHLSEYDADILRTGLKKGVQDRIDSVRDKFISGASNDSRTPEQALAIFDKLETYKGKYTFNQAHAITYAIAGVKEAIIKWKHPHVFVQAFILTKEDKAERKSLLIEFMSECGARGISMGGIDINTTHPVDVKYKDGVILPSLVMTGINPEFAASVNAVLEKEGAFTGMDDFINKLAVAHLGVGRYSVIGVPKRDLREFKEAVSKLAFLGGFDSIGLSPQFLPLFNSLDLVEKRNALHVAGMACIDKYLDLKGNGGPVYTGEILKTKNEIDDFCVQSVGYLNLSNKLPTISEHRKSVVRQVVNM